MVEDSRGSRGAEEEGFFFEQEDIVQLTISDEPKASSVEINPNITAELNDVGELIGIEILNFSTKVVTLGKHLG